MRAVSVYVADYDLNVVRRRTVKALPGPEEEFQWVELVEGEGDNLGGRRLHREGLSYRVFDSWGAARAHLVKKREDDVDQFRQSLERSLLRATEALAIPPTEPAA